MGNFTKYQAAYIDGTFPPDVKLGTAVKALQDGAVTPPDNSSLQISESKLQVKAGGVTPAMLSAAAKYEVPMRQYTAGNLAASVTATLLGSARGAGTIDVGSLALAVCGTDASNPLTAELDILINGVSIFTTKPKLAKTATGPVNTLKTGTGVTVGVVNAAANTVALGDVITYTVTVVRTASPSVEMSGLLVEAWIGYKVGA